MRQKSRQKIQPMSSDAPGVESFDSTRLNTIEQVFRDVRWKFECLLWRFVAGASEDGFGFRRFFEHRRHPKLHGDHALHTILSNHDTSEGRSFSSLPPVNQKTHISGIVVS